MLFPKTLISIELSSKLLFEENFTLTKRGDYFSQTFEDEEMYLVYENDTHSMFINNIHKPFFNLKKIMDIVKTQYLAQESAGVDSLYLIFDTYHITES